MMRMPGLAMPVLGVLGMEVEAMGWGTQPDDVLAWSPPGARVVPLEGVGHFVHIEQPDLVASLVLDFLGDPPPAPEGGWVRRRRHRLGRRRAGRLAPDRRGGTGDGARPSPTTAPSPCTAWRRATAPRPLLLLHGLGERSRCHVFAGWPGPVYGLDFTGHGASTIPAGGGYSAEILLADADAAVRHLGEVTVAGRGLGAYVALLLAGPARAVVVGHGAARRVPA